VQWGWSQLGPIIGTEVWEAGLEVSLKTSRLNHNDWVRRRIREIGSSWFNPRIGPETVLKAQVRNQVNNEEMKLVRKARVCAPASGGEEDEEDERWEEEGEGRG
jgi:hypothetical protein